MEKTLFGKTCEMGQILPYRYAPQNEPNRAKLSFSCILKHFCLKLTKNSLGGQKSSYLRNKLRITLNVIFFTIISKRGKSME